MCGGDGDDATRAAQQAEDERQRQIAQATAAIDRAFVGRGDQLDEFAAALREDFLTRATKQKDTADRRLKFALARGGQTGGSVARDAGTLLSEEFQEGLLQGERGVQASLADVLAADEATRQNLLALAQGGASATSAATAASNALRSNIEGARTDSLVGGIGDIFSSTRDLFVRAEEADARRRGLAESEIFAKPFSR